MTEQSAFLTTKLGVPGRRARQFERQRLRALLDGTPETRLVLVSAPAGFGKSTLLADWLASADIRGGWLCLDSADNDIVRFARYLTAAAEDLAGRKGNAGSFDAAPAFDPELALARTLESVTAASNGPGGGAVLVLDDYHVIEEPSVHRLVAALLEQLPPRARLAIATRADPRLPLARLRARGELLELRAAELRFTAEEAAELLRLAGLELAHAEVEALTERTEGWAAALRLVAVSLRDRPNHAELVQRFGASHRFVLDYVVEEVLAGLPLDTQDFLLRTSILERLSGPLCDAVTRQRGGQERLEELDRTNLLIVPLDDERHWYRYHALFADVLRARLQALHPDEVAELHARASAWHEEQRDDDDAIGHALASGDLERSCRVIAVASGPHLSAGELMTVRRWLDALPPDVVRNHAQLSASYAWCQLLAGETDGVTKRLADADAALAIGRDGGPAMGPGVPAQLALLRSQLAGVEGDSATAIAQARLARELVPAGLPPEGEANLRGTASALLALALVRAGDLDAAVEAYEEALPDLRAGNNALAVGRTIAGLAGIAISRGDPRRAVQLCESELEQPIGPCSAAGSGAVWAALARARAELGQWTAAEAAAQRALELATRVGDAPIARSAQATLDRIGPLLVGGLGDSRPVRRAGRDAAAEALTDRELEVLRLVALGRSNSQIASQLFVTVGTVKSHLHTISGKLGAANRVEAVARGHDLRLLD